MKNNSGVLVFVQVCSGKLMQVSMELLAKGRTLAEKKDCPLYGLLAFPDAGKYMQTLSCFGITKLYTMEREHAVLFREDIYADALVNCVQDCRPEIVLVGSTPEGKSMAASAAARLRTGLTADCTALQFDERGFLVQTRPAYGGKRMADIITPSCVPQMVTVRQGILNEPERSVFHTPEIRKISVKTVSGIQISSEHPSDRGSELAHAKIILAVGAGVQKREDLETFYNYAQKMNARLASSRALVEKGWMPARTQIGLSGSAVSPQLLICCGISGSVQFLAGIRNAKKVIAINTDENAPIFKEADAYIVGDMYKIFEKY